MVRQMRSFGAVSVVLLALSCGPANVLRLSGVLAPNADCSFPSADGGSPEVQLKVGRVDIGARRAAFMAILKVEGFQELARNETTLLGQTIENPPPSRVVLEEVVLNYEVSPRRGVAFKTETQAIRLDASPANANLYLNQNLLGAAAAELLEGLGLEVGERVILTVRIEVRGSVAGSGAKVSTGTISFPIEVVRSDLTSEERRCPPANCFGVACFSDAPVLDPRGCGTSNGPCCLYVGQLSAPNYRCCDSLECRL
jgi:hypothetical protein